MNDLSKIVAGACTGLACSIPCAMLSISDEKPVIVVAELAVGTLGGATITALGCMANRRVKGLKIPIITGLAVAVLSFTATLIISMY